MKPSRRTELEQQEEKMLALYACSNKRSKGKEYKEEADEYRMAFQRDRDRIIHSRAFRRLQGKTQVFMVGEGDHYRNRLTHTLEVQQIARDLARALGLNEDLSESIALAHDLGHPPFAHAGQDTLNQIMKSFGKNFEHNMQSRRIVEILENPYLDFPGLNLSLEVLDGLQKHTPVFDQHGKLQKISTLEAQIVDCSDEIAYYHHDLDDGFRSGIISITEAAKKVYLVKESQDIIQKKFSQKLSPKHFTRSLLKRIIDYLTRDILAETRKRILKYKIKTYADVLACQEPLIGFSAELMPQVKILRRYLYDNFYFSPYIKKQAKEADQILHELFEYYLKDQENLPTEEQERIAKGAAPEDIVKDYIAGMTDHFAMEQFRSIFPKKKVKAIQMSLMGE